MSEQPTEPQSTEPAPEKTGDQEKTPPAVSLELASLIAKRRSHGLKSTQRRRMLEILGTRSIKK